MFGQVRGDKDIEGLAQSPIQKEEER
jgi:hypothetical protein